MTASPLGRFSELAATIVTVAVVLAWLAVHLGFAVVADSSAIDLAATLVLGVVMGQRATTNGAGKIAAAANSRLDTLEQRYGITLRPTPDPVPAPVIPPAGNGGA